MAGKRGSRRQRQRPVQRGLFDAPAEPRPLEKKEPRLVLIDASGYIYRAYHALPPLTTASGIPTGATYGFTNMILKLIREEAPDHLVVVWDAEGPSFRDEIFAEYKANRTAAPDDLLYQFQYVRKIVDAWKLPQLEMEGFEADDIIAALVRRFGGEIDVVIASSDKDLMQLVTDRVKLLDTMRNKRYGPAEVKEKLGVAPAQVADYLALVGDTSDNVPGIPGVGPKTAALLLAQFGNLEAILTHSGEIERERLRKLVEEHKKTVRLSRQLVELRDPELDCDLANLQMPEPDRAALRALFEQLEFGRLVKEVMPGRVISRDGYRIARTREELDEVVAELSGAGAFAFDTETTSLEPMRAKLVGVSVCADDQRAWYLPVGHVGPGATPQLDPDDVRKTLGPLLADGRIPKIAQNSKYDVLVLDRHQIAVHGRIDEPMLASYVLNPSRNSHGLDALSLEILGHEMISFEEVAGKGAKQVPFDEVGIETAGQYSAEDANLTWLLWKRFDEQLNQIPSLRQVYEEIELPLVPVLMEMERVGIAIDKEFLVALSKEQAEALSELEARIYEAAGTRFNVASPQQLAEVLFKRLELPVRKRTKSGPSTDRSVLESLTSEHAVPGLILEHRELAKLKGTYVDALPELVNPETGRIHCSWNQTVAATGRLSSSDPNLQNIPIRTEEGRKIRRAFVAEPGHQFVSADYSQMELRVMAHVTADPILLDAFRRGEDVHARTAKEVFGTYSDDLRRRAKTINFGIIYGISKFGLARQLGIDREEAADFIERYLERYAGVRDYMKQTIEFARKHGYVETLFGRRRPMPEINHRNRAMREAAERAAINAPIQGTAADVMKKAMIQVAAQLQEEGLHARVVAQIHDELLIEAPDEETAKVRELLVAGMQGAAHFDVELAVDVATGPTWADV